MNEPLCDPWAGLGIPVSSMGAALPRAVGGMWSSQARAALPSKDPNPKQTRTKALNSSQKPEPGAVLSPVKPVKKPLVMLCSGSHLPSEAVWLFLSCVFQ